MIEKLLMVIAAHSVHPYSYIKLAYVELGSFDDLLKALDFSACFNLDFRQVVAVLVDLKGKSLRELKR